MWCKVGDKMKKVLLINASHRKKNSYRLLKEAEQTFKKQGFDTEIITLSDYAINYCKGCEVCILKEGCVVKDELDQVLKKIIQCDGLVIGTPVYLNNMTGILKTLIDRTCSWFHRTPVAQKPVFLIITTQGSGINNTLKSIRESLTQWGVCYCGYIGRKGRSLYDPIPTKDLAKFIQSVKEEGRGYKPTFNEVSTYMIQKVLATNVFPVDKIYWKEKRWMEAPYFHGAKVNGLKRIYSNIMYKMLCKVIKPYNEHEI